MSSNKQECAPRFGAPKSCPVLVGDTICGETNSLEIMKEFNRMYEEKMERMDTQAGGECLGEKIKLQQDWIRNLTQQNEMLVKAVQELEFEATERVHQLEEKLHKSAQCLCEGEKMLLEKDKKVSELSDKIKSYDGNMGNLSLELDMRKKECYSLKQELADVRQALTEEVATQHDQAVVLKKEVQQLEERCVQADKQIQFKEDIIKELRKEIKQLQQQVCIPEKPSSPDSGKPYIVVNHTSRKQSGKNTVIYINQDGTVRREVSSVDGPLLAIGYKQDHAASCGKCKGKFTLGSACKSETDLIAGAKNGLRPVTKRQQRSKFTIVDQTKRVLNEIDYEDRGDMRFIPVKMHVDQIEKGPNF